MYVRFAFSLHNQTMLIMFNIFIGFDEPILARRLIAKFWPDCAIQDTSMKFGTIVVHD